MVQGVLRVTGNSSSSGGVTSFDVSTLAMAVAYRFLIVTEFLSVSVCGQYRTYQILPSSGYADLRTCR